MASSNAPNGTFPATSAVTPSHPQLSPEAGHADPRRLRALQAGVPPRPDPDARDRMAAMLYRITGWEMFCASERAYVSRLWAEDWDSPEDSVYDLP